MTSLENITVRRCNFDIPSNDVMLATDNQKKERRNEKKQFPLTTTTRVREVKKNTSGGFLKKKAITVSLMSPWPPPGRFTTRLSTERITKECRRPQTPIKNKIPPAFARRGAKTRSAAPLRNPRKWCFPQGAHARYSFFPGLPPSLEKGKRERSAEEAGADRSSKSGQAKKRAIWPSYHTSTASRRGRKLVWENRW